MQRHAVDAPPETVGEAAQLFRSGRDRAADHPEKAVADSRRLRQARKAAKARGVGLAPERITEIVVEEWTRRGLDPPRGFDINGMIDQIARPPGTAERARNQIRVSTDLLGLPVRLRRLTKGGGLSQLAQRVGQDCGHAFVIATGDGTVDVQLAAASSERLARLAAQAVFFPSLMRITNVELRVGAVGGVEVWKYAPPDGPDRPDRPIGFISAPDASGFARLITIAARVDQPCICRVAVLRRGDGSWRMIVSRPLEPQRCVA